MNLINNCENPPVQKFETLEKTYVIDSINPSGGKCYRALKRLFDIVFSIVVGVITLPLMLVVAVMIKLDSPGEVFYCQERLGKNGKEFKIVKFRTMVQNAEKDEPVWADDDDLRCTKIGRSLRKCRLDEVPQVYNILMGHMSVVGPRPEREYFYNEFEKYIHGFSNRLCVKPGLTGLAQVNGGYYLRPEEKIVYDMEYIKSRSLWLDLKIMLKTVRVICKKEGAK